MFYRVLYGFVTFTQYYAKPMPNLCCTFIGRLRDPGIKPMLGRYWVICSLFCAMLAGLGLPWGYVTLISTFRTQIQCESLIVGFYIF